jgi:hypothetical protein
MYQVTIGIDSSGNTIIGAAECRTHEATSTERVYGAQIGHRVAALVGDQWLLCTPTVARRLGAVRTVRFPPARRR